MSAFRSTEAGPQRRSLAGITLLLSAVFLSLGLLTAGMAHADGQLDAPAARTLSPEPASHSEILRAPPPTDPPSPLSQARYITRVGSWPYGPSWGLDVDSLRNHIYLSAGGAVLTLDGTDRSNPLFLLDGIHSQGLVKDIFYAPADRRLYLACGESGFEIWDVADPLNPQRLSVTEVLYEGYEVPVNHVEVFQHYCILECHWGFVWSYDVSDPTHPVQVGGSGLMGNPAHDIHVSPDGEVHSTGAQRYQRLLISPDGTLHNSGYKDFTYGAHSVFGTEDIAFVDYGAATFLLDLHDPALRPFSVIETGEFDDDVVRDDHLLGINLLGLSIYDVTHPIAPYLLGQAPTVSEGVVLVAAQDHAYVSELGDGLEIMDIHDVSDPVSVGTYTDVWQSSWQTAVDGNYAYVAEDADGMIVLDITSQEDPPQIARFDTEYARDVAVSGGYACVADYYGGLYIIDVSDPSNPTLAGRLAGVHPWRVILSGSLAYLIDVPDPNQPYWLSIVDVSDPATPAVVGSLLLADRAQELALTDDGYLYVGCAYAGVQVVDVSDSTAPSAAGSYDLSLVTDVKLHGDLLYVANFGEIGEPDGGFYVLNIADRAHPTYVGSFQATGFAPLSLATTGDYAYVNDGSDLHLLFVGDPSDPLDLDAYRVPGSLYGVNARGPYIYVSDGTAGVQILQNTLYGDPTGGLMWEQLSSGVTRPFYDVAFPDAQNGWAVGANGLIRHTNDGGDTWTGQSGLPGVPLYGVDFADASTGWVVGGGGRIIHTVNGGNVWTTQTSGTAFDLYAVDFIDATTGWAVGDGGTLLHTTNGGATWAPQASGTAFPLNDVSFTDASHGWVAIDDTEGYVARTVDGGGHWTIVDTGAQNFLNAVSFADALHGCTVGSFGEIRRTTDGGLSWIAIPAPFPPDWLNDVFFLDAQTGWAVGYDGHIIATRNSGVTWSNQETGIHDELNAIAFADATHGWAVGEGGTILRTVVPATDVAGGQAGLPTRGAVLPRLTSAPNPFSAGTTIRYELAQAERVSVAVFDAQGRRVRRIESGPRSAGEWQAVWDSRDEEGRPVAAGIYFGRVTAGDVSAVTRMVVIR